MFLFRCWMSGHSCRFHSRMMRSWLPSRTSPSPSLEEKQGLGKQHRSVKQQNTTLWLASLHPCVHLTCIGEAQDGAIFAGSTVHLGPVHWPGAGCWMQHYCYTGKSYSIVVLDDELDHGTNVWGWTLTDQKAPLSLAGLGTSSSAQPSLMALVCTDAVHTRHHGAKEKWS